MTAAVLSPTRIRINNFIHRSFIKRWFVKSFYNKFNTLLTDDVQFMNWGYAVLGSSEQELLLNEHDEPQRYPLQMYYQVAGAVPVARKDVLEVGSGRGGGAEFLTRYFKPASYTGVDLSPANVEFCNRQHQLPGLRFTRGDAQELPFDDEQFDCVINVESSHCYPRPEQFLQEVFRVLRRGGHLLMSDFRDVADTIPPSTESRSTLLKQIRDAGFVIVEAEDITANVVRSLDLDHDRKVAAFDKMTGAQKEKMGDVVQWVMALKNGPIYKDFAEGRKCYMRFVCRKD